MSELLPVGVDKGTGTPLVLLHGLGNTHTSWDFVLDHINDDQWRVIVPDLLGFGDAPKPSVSYTPKEHATAIKELLDHLGIEKAVIAGHSMGCIVAIALAYYYPEYASRLLLFGAPLYRKKPTRSWLQRLLRTEGMYFSLFEIVQKNPDAVQAGGAAANELLPFIKGMEITPEVWPAYKKSLENTIMQFHSYEQVISLKIPVLFVNGLLDFFIIRKNITASKKANRAFIQTKTVLGPHELTPRQGKVVARIIAAVKQKHSRHTSV